MVKKYIKLTMSFENHYLQGVFEVGRLEKEYHEHKKYNIKYFISTFILIFLISFLILFIIEKEIRSSRLIEIKNNEEQVVQLEADYLENEYNRVFSDLNYLQKAYKDDLVNDNNFRNTMEDWKIISSERNIYDQIRFLDAKGNERIRINNDGDGAYIVPEVELQNKSDRYYFYEAINLELGEVHVSPLDLNIESNEIELPYKPVVRFSTPLFDSNMQTKGVVVLNHLSKKTLDNFREIGANSYDYVMLLNSDGYWLSDTNRKLEWNFMFEDLKEESFKKQYMKEWNQITNTDGQFTTSNGLFTSKKFGILENTNKISGTNSSKSQSRDFYIVSMVRQSNNNRFLFINNTPNLIIDIIKTNPFQMLFIVMLSSVLAFLVYVNRSRYSETKYYAKVDALTNVYNRRAGLNKIKQIFSQKNYKKSVTSLCFIDINGLKQVNDFLGHQLGDELILTVTDTIKSVIRDKDLIIRMGGDEFLIMFNESNKEQSEVIWKRVLEQFDKINKNEKRPYLISVSHGIVSSGTAAKIDIDDLIRKADMEMYDEKIIIHKSFKIIR